MKQTIDGVSQLPRIWYYLLDFNDQDNWETIERLSGQKKLGSLTDKEFKLLFITAVEKDKTC